VWPRLKGVLYALAEDQLEGCCKHIQAQLACLLQWWSGAAVHSTGISQMGLSNMLAKNSLHTWHDAAVQTQLKHKAWHPAGQWLLH